MCDCHGCDITSATCTLGTRLQHIPSRGLVPFRLQAIRLRVITPTSSISPTRCARHPVVARSQSDQDHEATWHGLKVLGK